jgi:hypothetical protein
MWVGALVSAFSLGLSLYQPYVDAKGKLPLEWVVLASWLALGGIFWAAARRIRGNVSEAERRSIIVGEVAA